MANDIDWIFFIVTSYFASGHGTSLRFPLCGIVTVLHLIELCMVFIHPFAKLSIVSVSVGEAIESQFI